MIIDLSFMPNVRDHRHRTAGATSAGSVATKHSACQRVGVRWIAWFDLFLWCFLPRENPIVAVMVLALQNLFRKAKPIVMIYRDVVQREAAVDSHGFGGQLDSILSPSSCSVNLLQRKLSIRPLSFSVPLPLPSNQSFVTEGDRNPLDLTQHGVILGGGKLRAPSSTQIFA